MAIAYVQDFEGNFSFTDTGSATVPAGGVAQGNHLILAIAISHGTHTVLSVTDSQGNSYSQHDLLQDAGNGFSVFLWSGYMTTALDPGDLVTVTISASWGAGFVIAEFSGLATSSWLDKSATFFENFDTTHTSTATDTTSQANELLVGVHGKAATWTPTNGFTVADEVAEGGGQVLLQYKTVSSTGTYESTGTTDVSSPTWNIIGTFKEAGGGATNATIDLDTGNVVAGSTAASTAPPRPRPAHPYSEINLRM